jgi:hypothetical protein
MVYVICVIPIEVRLVRRARRMARGANDCATAAAVGLVEKFKPPQARRTFFAGPASDKWPFVRQHSDTRRAQPNKRPSPTDAPPREYFWRLKDLLAFVDFGSVVKKREDCETTRNLLSLEIERLKEEVLFVDKDSSLG